MRPETAVKLEKALDAERSEQEGHRQPQRIYREQQNALEHRILCRGKAQDHGQDGPHTRGPAEGKGEANHESSSHGAPALHVVQTLVSVQRVDAEDSGQMQPEKDNDHTCDLREQRLVARHQLANFGRDCAQRDEHDAEAQNEADGIQHHFAQQLGFLRLQFLNPHSGDQGHVTGHQREHAGREK